MKPHFLSMLLAASVWLFNACSKDKDKDDSGLVGTWEYVSATGGIAGTTIYPDDLILLQLKSDLSYKLYRNNNVEETGHYYLDTVQNNVKIHFDGSLFIDNRFHVNTWLLFNHTADQFFLYPDGWADAYAYKMKRKR